MTLPGWVGYMALNGHAERQRHLLLWPVWPATSAGWPERVLEHRTRLEPACQDVSDWCQTAPFHANVGASKQNAWQDVTWAKLWRK